MKFIEWILMIVVALLVGIMWTVQASELPDGGPLVVEMGVMPTATPETVYVDLAWGQKMYVRCSEDRAKVAQPVGELGMVSFGSEVWGVECYPPGTNEGE